MLTDQFLDNDITLSAEDYYLTDEARHELRFGDRVEYVPCVGDALIVAALVDHEPVTVRSFDPVTDEPVVFEITDENIDVTPDEHVVSIPEPENAPDSGAVAALS